MSFGKSGAVGEYVFFHSADIVKLLSTYYLVFKCHAEKKDSHFEMHINKLKFYLMDVYNIQEVKYEEFNSLLRKEGLLELGLDKDNLPNVMKVKNVDAFRAMLVFFNTQRVTDDAKKLKISSKCQKFLKAIIDNLVLKGTTNEKAEVNISDILESFKANKVPICDEDLRDAIDAGLAGDIMVGKTNKLTSVVQYSRVKKLYPAIKMMNAIKQVNESKTASK